MNELEKKIQGLELKIVKGEINIKHIDYKLNKLDEVLLKLNRVEINQKWILASGTFVGGLGVAIVKILIGVDG